MRCLTSIRYNMFATILNDFAPESGKDVDTQVKGGHWETVQDEETGAIRRLWVEDEVTATPPSSPGTNWQVNSNRFDIECSVTGFTEVGFRSSANTENFLKGDYTAIEVVQMKFPPRYVLNRRQFVTNIRGRDKTILWLEEETGQPTVFEIQGVVPTFDPFGRHLDNLAVLKRSDIQ